MDIKAYKFIRNLLILSTAFTQFSCLKDNDPFQKQKDSEKQLIENYISLHGANARLSTSGLYYIETTEGTGDSVKVNDEAIFTYKAYKLETPDKLFDTSDKGYAKIVGLNTTYALFEGPAKIKVNVGWYYSLGVAEGLLSMKEGGSAKFVIPGSLVFGDYVPYLFEVTLHKVVKDARKFELAQIDSFFVKNSIYVNGTNTIRTNADSASFGFYSFNQTSTAGIDIANNDSVTVKYSLSLMPYIDRSKNLEISERIVFPEQTFAFKMGVTTLFPIYNFSFYVDFKDGFNEAVKTMKEGEKARVIVPFYRGYGTSILSHPSTTQWIIPQNSTLLYDLEIIKVRKK